MNICGCLVQIAPAFLNDARARMAAMEGVEIHGESDDGRLVVVVEDTATELASEIIMTIHQIPGVVSFTLTYHHFEDLADADAPAPIPPTGGHDHDHI